MSSGKKGPIFDTIASNQSNLNVLVVSALAAGANTIGKIDILGNAGGIMDAAGRITG